MPDKYRTIVVMSVDVEASKGSHVSEVIRESAILSLTERRPVFVTFNGKTYRVSPQEIVDLIMKTESA